MSKIDKPYRALLREQVPIGLNLGLLFLSGTHAAFYVSMKEILDFNQRSENFCWPKRLRLALGPLTALIIEVQRNF